MDLLANPGACNLSLIDSLVTETTWRLKKGVGLYCGCILELELELENSLLDKIAHRNIQ